jgi:hypothetical protein
MHGFVLFMEHKTNIRHKIISQVWLHYISFLPFYNSTIQHCFIFFIGVDYTSYFLYKALKVLLVPSFSRIFLFGDVLGSNTDLDLVWKAGCAASRSRNNLIGWIRIRNELFRICNTRVSFNKNRQRFLV